MLDGEANLSRRLTIAGSLWRLTDDDVFAATLIQMQRCDNAILKQAHFEQILWLKDERALSIYYDLIDDSDSFVRFLALTQLNEIELGRRFLVPESDLPHQLDYYRSRQDDASFRATMIERLKKYVEQ